MASFSNGLTTNAEDWLCAKTARYEKANWTSTETNWASAVVTGKNVDGQAEPWGPREHFPMDAYILWPNDNETLESEFEKTTYFCWTKLHPGM